MIEQIKEQAALIQDGLWEIARDSYGLDRTQETRDRIEATISARLNQERKGSGIPLLDIENGHDAIDSGLATAFMATALAEREKDYDEAVKLLSLAAEAYGMQCILGILRKKGILSPDQLRALQEGAFNKVHASAMAKQRHKENYKLADEALEFWRKNISPNLSAQKAATELQKVVPLSHKKLAELISTEKKKVSRVRRLELVRTP